MSQLLLGLRADPSHTEATLVAAGGQVWGRVRIPNAQASSSRELLERAFQEASIELPGPIPPLVAVMALPGLRTGPLRRSAAETVRAILPQGSRALICDELEPVLAVHLQGAPGLLLWSDLEAAVAQLDSDLVYTRHSEEPDPLGQEGSGLWLGTRTLQLTARLLEGRLPESSRLSEILAAHFGQPTVSDVWEQVMSEPPDADGLTELALRTIELARNPEPEPSCRALVVRAARRLGELLSRAELPASENLAASWGGRTAVGALLDEVKEQNSHLGWRPPLHGDPLSGCLRLAQTVEESVDLAETSVDDITSTHWRALREQAVGGLANG